jgi:sporulation protein YlmC with PRC-barrel domain
MLQLSNSLLRKPVLSLRTGQQVATAMSPLFNPDNLKIEGFYCEDTFDKKQLILLWQDIREVLKEGFVVNDHDVLTEPDELVRFKDILALHFDPLGKQVVTISKERIGKVSDYAIETESMYVQKIYVSQSLLKSLTGGSLSVDRNQINEITNKRIIINDLLQDSKVTADAAIA